MGYSIERSRFQLQIEPNKVGEVGQVILCCSWRRRSLCGPPSEGSSGSSGSGTNESDRGAHRGYAERANHFERTLLLRYFCFLPRTQLFANQQTAQACFATTHHSFAVAITTSCDYCDIFGSRDASRAYISESRYLPPLLQESGRPFTHDCRPWSIHQERCVSIGQFQMLFKRRRLHWA